MGTLKKVSPGAPFRPSASDHNAFIDAAQAHRDRAVGAGGAEPLSRQNTVVLVRNDTGADRDRFAVLGIDGPIIHPDDNENEFKNRVVLSGVLPVYGAPPTGHDGLEVVLAEPLKDGAIGRAYIDGVCPVRLQVGVGKEGKLYCAHHADNYRMVSFTNGGHTILWREGGTGEQWAVIRMGRPFTSYIFPMIFAQVGGSNGSVSTPASWTYNCTDVSSGATLLSGVNPVSSPHKYVRPTIGKMTKATVGMAYENALAQIVICWTNEVPEVEVCA